MGSSWAVCQDIGRRYAAIVAGFMNMVGNFGGFVATAVSGMDPPAGPECPRPRPRTCPSNSLPRRRKTAGLMPGYQINFFVFAAVYVIGVICWLRIDATRPVAGED